MKRDRREDSYRGLGGLIADLEPSSAGKRTRSQQLVQRRGAGAPRGGLHGEGQQTSDALPFLDVHLRGQHGDGGGSPDAAQDHQDVSQGFRPDLWPESEEGWNRLEIIEEGGGGEDFNPDAEDGEEQATGDVTAAGIEVDQDGRQGPGAPGPAGSDGQVESAGEDAQTVGEDAQLHGGTAQTVGEDAQLQGGTAQTVGEDAQLQGDDRHSASAHEEVEESPDSEPLEDTDHGRLVMQALTGGGGAAGGEVDTGDKVAGDDDFAKLVAELDGGEPPTPAHPRPTELDTGGAGPSAGPTTDTTPKDKAEDPDLDSIERDIDAVKKQLARARSNKPSTLTPSGRSSTRTPSGPSSAITSKPTASTTTAVGGVSIAAWKAAFKSTFAPVFGQLGFPANYETLFSPTERQAMHAFMTASPRKLPATCPFLGNGKLSIAQKILIAGVMHALDRNMTAGAWGRTNMKGQQRTARAKDCGSWVRLVWAYVGLVTHRGKGMPKSVRKTWRSPAFRRQFSKYLKDLRKWKKGGRQGPKPKIVIGIKNRDSYVSKSAFQNLKPGDWVMFDWRRGGNHSVIFIRWKRKPTGSQTVGLAYTMDQNNNKIGGGNIRTRPLTLSCVPRSSHGRWTSYVYEIRHPK